MEAMLRKCIYNFLQLPQGWNSPKETSLLITFQKLQSRFFESQKHFSNSSITLKNNSEIPSALFKYELFSEENAPIILDVEEERQKIINDEKMFDEFEKISLKKGITGIFNIQEIVQLLQKEKGEEIFVVKIPSEFNYADYIVTVNGRSARHMLAMSTLVRKIYKRRVEKTNMIPNLEGKNSKIWMALDLGNIVLHIFSKEGRKAFDLETLWSVGKHYDSLSLRKKSIPEDLIDYAKILANLSPNK